MDLIEKHTCRHDVTKSMKIEEKNEEDLPRRHFADSSRSPGGSGEAGEAAASPLLKIFLNFPAKFNSFQPSAPPLLQLFRRPCSPVWKEGNIYARDFLAQPWCKPMKSKVCAGDIRRTYLTFQSGL